MKRTSILALLLALVMMLGLFAGCASKPAATPPADTTTEAPETTEKPADEPAEKPADEPAEKPADEPAADDKPSSGLADANSDVAYEDVVHVDNSTYSMADKIFAAMEPASTKTYPLVTDGTTFTCWWPSNLNAVNDYNETAIFQYMEELTGVHLEFTHAGATAAEQYNLMLVSGDLTDMVRQLYTYHTKGLDNAIDDEWYYDMMTLEEYMPNMFDRLYSDHELFLQSLTDSGYLAGLPMLMSESEDWVNGNFIRQDLLTKYNFEMPETVEELHQFLLTCKANEASCAPGPLWMNNSCFTGIEGAFGIVGMSILNPHTFLLKDGKVTPSVLEPGYKDYIGTLAQWYSEGLISSDFASDSSFIAVGTGDRWLNGEFALTWDCFVYLDEQNAIAQGMNPDFQMVPMPVISREAGETVHTLNAQKLVWQGALGISTKCENVELACAYWDSIYAGEPMLFANYGEEGVTCYIGEDGIPHYNEFAIYGNEEFPSANQIQNYYMFLDAPYYRIGGRTYDTMTETELACGPAWTKGDANYMLPANITLTTEEGEESAWLLSDINTYIAENQAKFVTGARSMDEFDDFIATVESMGIMDAAEIYQAAVERYNDRSALVPTR